MRGIIFGLMILTLPKLSEASLHSINLRWEDVSRPSIMSPHMNHRFEDLPLRGEIKNSKRLWSGDYWALRYGNINYRWYAKVQKGFNLKSPSREEARRMTIPELAQLSPAEKYDLYTGRYDYPLKAQVDKIANPQALIWEGICHGWAPASINHDEPLPKLMRNPDGIEVPFGSTDIKALLSYYYAYGFHVNSTHQMGTRCEGRTIFNQSDSCDEDLNAGAFHIVLANKIGIENKSFVIDTQRLSEVWNNPIHSYQTSIVNENLSPASNSAPGTQKVIRVKSQIIIPGDGENRWQPTNGTPFQDKEKLFYEYDLDIDSAGNIIGGSWISSSRPDFLWLKDKPIRYDGILFKLGNLLN